MILKTPKAVIFDWDNTLVNSWPVIHYAINQTMKAMNKDLWSLQKVKQNIHKSMREYFPQIFGNNWQQAGEIYVNSYKSQHLEKLQFLPNASELINFFYQREVPLFLVSNKIGSTLRLEAEALKVSHKFSAIVGSKDAMFDKPHKAPVDLALQNSKINPSQDLTWFIGDTITDVECAINSGCKPIMYGEEFKFWQDLMIKQRTINQKIHHFSSHQEILLKLEKIMPESLPINEKN